ncbi:MAG: hypothetical protein HY826_11095 [Actinobacteria bacterium]|nr:hypothetical protein [Actinomycetota bacterium]
MTTTATDPPDIEPAFDPVTDAAAWRRIVRKAGLVYLFSRACVLIGTALVAAELRADANVVDERFPGAPWADPDYANAVIPKTAARPMLDVLTSWDGDWYLRIVRLGYPRFVAPNANYDRYDARAAFFPAYPLLVKTVDRILPGGPAVAAVVVNFLLGALVVYLAGLVARELFGLRVSERTMVLVSLFPGSFVLSFAYAEPLLLVLVGGCLLFLLKRQWALAGVLAAIGTATRPNGLALVAACAVASVVAIRERREWRSLIAPVLAPLGFIGFQLWLGAHTGERGVWFRVQTEAWGEGTSFGLTAIGNTVKAFTNPLTSPTKTITAVSLLAMFLLLWFLYKVRLPAAVNAYVGVVLLLMLMPKTVTARPRFLFTAFPLLIAAAVWFERDKRDWWPYVIGACSAGLVGLTALYGVRGAIP